jgi:hypothetical protein
VLFWDGRQLRCLSNVSMCERDIDRERGGENARVFICSH